MKKKFMVAFAAVASSFAMGQAVANTAAFPETKIAQKTIVASAEMLNFASLKTNSDDALDFVLQRSAEADLSMAPQRSHRSHSSHRSHRSHYSSR
jgi:hypothetical protein